MVRLATAFSPCSITGFFRIFDQTLDPLRAGSTGASVAIGNGVNTSISLKRSSVSRVAAEFNRIPLAKTSTSCLVAEKYTEMHGGNWNIKVSHASKLPMGCGYGTSGAGALGLSLALNEAIGLGLSRIEAAQVSHVCEVVRKTGLGTVASALSGGISIRKEPGAPGVGKILKMSAPASTRVVSAAFGPLSTARVLRNSLLRTRVDRCAKGLTDKLERGRSHKNFMTFSRRFSDCLGLSSHRLSKIITDLESGGFMTSMMMLGESLFGLFPLEEASELRKVLTAEHFPSVVSTISRSGAQLT